MDESLGRGEENTRSAKNWVASARLAATGSPKSSSNFGPFVAKLIVLALLVAMVLGLSSVMRKSVQDSFARTTTTLALPTTGPTSHVPTPEVGFAITCVKHGSGYRVGFTWPFLHPGLDESPEAIELSTDNPFLVVAPSQWRRGTPGPKPLEGIGPNITMVYTLTGIMADGTRLSPRVISRTTDAQSC